MTAQDAHTAEASWLAGELVPQIPERLLRSLVAHRGFHCPELSDSRPLECTLPALRLAWESGLPNCECDVRLSADGEILLLHDETLERLAPSNGAAQSRCREEHAHILQSFPLKQPGTHLASLESALNAAWETGGRLVVELKDDKGVGKAVANHANLLSACCVVMSFDVEELAGFCQEFERKKEAILAAGQQSAPCRPLVLLLTCMPKDAEEGKFEALDFGSPRLLEEADEWLSSADLCLDGFYVEWTPELTGKHQEAFRQLCQRCTVGVWQYYGQPDSVDEASRLLDLGAAFCNTDLPGNFAENSRSDAQSTSPGSDADAIMYIPIVTSPQAISVMA